MKISVIIITAMLIAQVSASFFDVFQGAVQSVQSSFGKLFSDVVTDVKETVDCTILAVEHVLSLSQDATARYYEKCGAPQNGTMTEEPKESSPKVEISITNNEEILKQEIPEEIEARINATLMKLLNDYNPHDILEDVEKGLTKESERLADISELVKQELDKISNEIHFDFNNLEKANSKPTVDSILERLKILEVLEEHLRDRPEAKEVHKVIDNVLHKLNAIEAADTNENIKVEGILKHLEKDTNSSYTDIMQQIQTLKDEEAKHLEVIKTKLEEHEKSPEHLEFIQYSNLNNTPGNPHELKSRVDINELLLLESPANERRNVLRSVNATLSEVTLNKTNGNPIRVVASTGILVTNNVTASDLLSESSSKSTIELAGIAASPSWMTELPNNEQSALSTTGALSSKQSPASKTYSPSTEQSIVELTTSTTESPSSSHSAISTTDSLTTKQSTTSSIETHIIEESRILITEITTRQLRKLTSETPTVKQSTKSTTQLPNTKQSTTFTTQSPITKQTTTSTESPSTKHLTTSMTESPTTEHTTTSTTESLSTKNIKTSTTESPSTKHTTTSTIEIPSTKNITYSTTESPSTEHTSTSTTESLSTKNIITSTTESPSTEHTTTSTTESLSIEHTTTSTTESSSTKNITTSTTESPSTEHNTILTTETLSTKNITTSTTESPSIEHTTTSTTEIPSTKNITTSTTESPSTEHTTTSTTESSSTKNITTSTTESPITELSSIIHSTTQSPSTKKLTTSTTSSPTSEISPTSTIPSLGTKQSTKSTTNKLETNIKPRNINIYSNMPITTNDIQGNVVISTTAKIIKSTLQAIEKVTSTTKLVNQQSNTRPMQTKGASESTTPVAITPSLHVNENSHVITTPISFKLSTLTTVPATSLAPESSTNKKLTSTPILTKTQTTVEAEEISLHPESNLLTTVRIHINGVDANQYESMLHTTNSAVITKTTENEESKVNADSNIDISSTTESMHSTTRRPSVPVPNLNDYLNYIDRVVNSSFVQGTSKAVQASSTTMPPAPLHSEPNDSSNNSSTPPINMEFNLSTMLPPPQNAPSYSANTPLATVNLVGPLKPLPLPLPLSPQSQYNNIPSFARNVPMHRELSPPPSLQTLQSGYNVNSPSIEPQNNLNSISNFFNQPSMSTYGKPTGLTTQSPSNTPKINNFDDPDYDSFFHIPAKNTDAHDRALKEARRLIAESKRAHRIIDSVLNKNKGRSAFNMPKAFKFG